ncbi:MAG: hypothetical protein KF760_07230 [Candidatus Eremiobacteraeota bacterium]|nr:hypothetical protein [Candidatus Eremiobacteraeota bacterium]MCW5869207.1 hypothetical protein [Candidatus Eremiobacteraeota bacterium]
MKRFLCLLLLLLCPVVLFAQDGLEYVEVEVNDSQPKGVLVRPGGKKDVIRLYGRGFELVKRAEIHHASQPCKPITCKFKLVARGMADLEVTAAADAQPGEDYQLVLFTSKASYPAEYLSVEVRDPNE